LLEHEDYEDAKLVKVLSEAGVFFDPRTKFAKVAEKGSKVHALNAAIESMTIENRKVLREIAHQEAEQYFAEGEAILATASELAMNSVEAAVLKLIRANELFLAYHVAKILKVNALDHIHFLLGMRFERLKQMEHAAYYYKNCRNPRTQQLFAARNKLDYSKYGVSQIVDYAKLAEQSTSFDSVFYHVMAGNLEVACKQVIEKTKSKK